MRKKSPTSSLEVGLDRINYSYLCTFTPDDGKMPQR
jgi:hypothetical protein